MWAIWNSRNAIVSQDEAGTSQGTGKTALNLYQEYQKAKHIPVAVVPRVLQRWQAPPDGFVKINFDGGICVHERLGGLGVIARDSGGNVLGALQTVVKEVMEPVVVEAYAAAKALEFGKDMGFQKIILEGDALKVIQQLNQSEQDFSIIVTSTDEEY